MKESAKSIARQAADLVQQDLRLFGDSLLFGLGGSPGKHGKRKPIYPNTLHRPLSGRASNGRRVPRRAGPYQRKKHINGDIPLFTAGCRNTRLQRWAYPDQLAALFRRSGAESNYRELASRVIDGELSLPMHAVRDAMGASWRDDEGRAHRLFEATFNREDEIGHLLRYLVYLDPGVTGDPLRRAEPDWWIARELIAGAKGWSFRDRKYSRLTVDIDGHEDGSNSAEALELAHGVALDLSLEHDVKCYVETSRSRTGAYVSFLVTLDDMTTVDFNARVGRLRTLLAERYGTQADNQGVGICRMKGMLFEWQPNPDYDRRYALETAETHFAPRHMVYAKERARAELPGDEFPDHRDRYTWNHDLRLEALTLRGTRDLITTPLHGACLDADCGQARVKGYQQLLDERAQSYSATELFDRLGVAASDFPAAADAAVAAVAADTQSDASAPSVSPPVPAAVVELPLCPKKLACLPRPGSVDEEKLFGSDVWQSYLAAGRLCLRQAGGDVEVAAHMAVELRERIGVASGIDHDDRVRRLFHSRRAIEYAMQEFELGKSTGGGGDFIIDQKEWIPVRNRLAKLIPQHVIELARRKRRPSKLNLDRLAVAFVAIQLTMHDDFGEQGAAPATRIRRGVSDTLNEVAHTQLSAAALELLVERQLLMVTRQSSHTKHQCRQYALTAFSPLCATIAALPKTRQLISYKINFVYFGPPIRPWLPESQPAWAPIVQTAPGYDIWATTSGPRSSVIESRYDAQVLPSDCDSAGHQLPGATSSKPSPDDSLWPPPHEPFWPSDHSIFAMFN